MKKNTLIGVSLLIIAAIAYYYIQGQQQLINTLKQQVHQELQIIEQHGIEVVEKKEEKDTEHFVLLFKDPQRYLDFLHQNGIKITLRQAKYLQGLKLGVDIHYLPSTSKAVAIDLYPLTLPKGLYDALVTNQEEKLALQLSKLVKEKKILIHTELDKTLHRFDGYARDINETIQSSEPVVILSKKLQFDGTLSSGTIQRFTQTLALLSLQQKESTVLLKESTNSYERTGDTPYDYKTIQSFGALSLQLHPNVRMFADYLEINVASNEHNGTVSSTLEIQADKVGTENGSELIALEGITAKSRIENIDISALEILQKADPNDQTALKLALEKLVSKGITMEIPKLEVKKVRKGSLEIDGFALEAKFKVDKSVDLTLLAISPLLVADKVTAKLHLVLSEDLFTLISQDPRAKIALMLFQPKEENGKKVYEIELNKGKLMINGRPLI